MIKHVWIILLCILVLTAVPVKTLAADENGNTAEFEKHGDAIMEILSQESCQAGDISTGIIMNSDQEVRQFADFFYKRYYYGCSPLTVYYVTYSNKPGQYALGIRAEAPQEAARQQKTVKNKFAEVTCGLLSKTEYGKALEIYQWVYDNYEYDYSYINNNVYSAFQTGKTACNGYTRMFQGLCSAAGLTCEVVVDGNHAWNRVVIDGQWRYVDVTWNKNISENRWLFVTKEEMDRSHNPQGV